MVLCILALPIFAILSIFSVKYRQLTLDSLDCLFRTVSLRKCQSGLDDRMRAGISGTFLKFSPNLASFFYKNYKFISWIIVLLFVTSFYFSSVGIYNYVKYGNCNGPENPGVCIFDTQATKECGVSDVGGIADYSNYITPTLEEEDPMIGSLSAKLTIIEFGCYTCKYTKVAEPIIKEVLKEYDNQVNLQFKTFYSPIHEFSYEASLAAQCALEQGKYWEFHDLVFKQNSLDEGTIVKIAQEIGLDKTLFTECISNEKYKDVVEKNQLEGSHAGVQGTPTFFINDKKIVGSQPFKTFKAIIDEELKK